VRDREGKKERRVVRIQRGDRDGEKKREREI